MVGGSRVVNLARRGEKEPLLETRGIFFLCFDGVISTCRNVFPMTFLGLKTKRELRTSFAAAAFQNHPKAVPSPYSQDEQTLNTNQSN
jgi:hypothetical protein